MIEPLAIMILPWFLVLFPQSRLRLDRLLGGYGSEYLQGVNLVLEAELVPLLLFISIGIIHTLRFFKHLLNYRLANSFKGVIKFMRGLKVVVASDTLARGQSDWRRQGKLLLLRWIVSWIKAPLRRLCCTSDDLILHHAIFHVCNSPWNLVLLAW